MFTKVLKKKRTIGVIAAVAVFAIAGMAIAYWTTGGSGSGSGSVASASGSNVTLHGTIASALTPGGSSSVTFTADNGNSSSTLVGTIHAEVSIDEAHATAGCKASDFTISDVEENQLVDANATGVALTNNGTISMADTSENQDACQGATISLALSS